MHVRPCHLIDAQILAACTCIRVGFSVYVMNIMQKHTIMLQVHVTYNGGLDSAYAALNGQSLRVPAHMHYYSTARRRLTAFKPSILYGYITQ
jgi:hypothetical protein